MNNDFKLDNFDKSIIVIVVVMIVIFITIKVKGLA